jgi:hypothetical protein
LSREGILKREALEKTFEDKKVKEMYYEGSGEYAIFHHAVWTNE